MFLPCRYHCHTCKMVDGVGVCTVCAKVCHKDHEISYAKYGSFFCDCGAKEDGSCLVSDGTFTVSHGQLVSNTGIPKADQKISTSALCGQEFIVIVLLVMSPFMAQAFPRALEQHPRHKAGLTL